MHVLLIKMSSMGDTIHTLPALTDALRAIPNLEIDWVVEPAFQDIPSWHPAVKNIILIPFRKWRKNKFSLNTYREIKKFLHQLRKKKYDSIIDAQGLLKSALVAKCARGEVYGYDKNSAREGISSYFYNYKFSIERKQHAVRRIRKLFALTLGYEFQNTTPDYQTISEKLPTLPFSLDKKYLVFLHGTTWDSKHYPDQYWEILLQKAAAEKIPVYLLWGNETEKKRAEKFAAITSYVKILPKMSITQLATVLKNATAVISVDTGLGHLSAAMHTPTVSLYGPSNAELVGIVGPNQIHLQANFPCSPCMSRTCVYAKTHKTDIVPACFTTISPDKVWEQVMMFLMRMQR